MSRSSAAPSDRRLAAACLIAAAAVATLAVSASAAPPGTWKQIAHSHNGAKTNLGLARGKDGTLHVLWAGPGRRTYTAVFDTPISLAGAAGAPQTVVSGWSSLNAPAAATTPDGAVHAIVSGQKILSNTDPNAGLNEVVGPGSWALEAAAFGSSSITVASNSDVATAVLKSGQLVNVWQSAASMLFQTGVSPSTAPQNISTPGDPGTAPALAVDPVAGDAVMAYYGTGSGSAFFRRLLPTLDAPVAMPQSKAQGPSLAARTTGGVYSAYATHAKKVWLLRFGGQPKAVPVRKGARVLTAGVAAGPEGRLWIFAGDERTTYVTRTNKAASRYEPVQALKSPPKTVQYFRLEGEGSAGPLDLFADVTIDGTLNDGTYFTHVLPVLSLNVSKKALKDGVQVTVHVSDAGDPVGGAKVAGLPGGPKTTGKTGAAVFTLAAGKGAFAVTASKAGYVAAKRKVTV